MTYTHIEYANWGAMMQRCYDPDSINYAYYGGRGIKVCERWHDFNVFLADMGPRPTKNHTLDRIDVDGDYCPENCRWSTRSEQAHNRRLYAGNVEDRQPKKRHIYARIRAGWEPERARTEPLRIRYPQKPKQSDECTQQAEDEHNYQTMIGEGLHGR